jgi:hypothetical protein
MLKQVLLYRVKKNYQKRMNAVSLTLVTQTQLTIVKAIGTFSET